MNKQHSDWNAPQFYRADWQPNFLGGGGRWSVVMNNWCHITDAPDQDLAEREAARLNYTEGCYARPQMIGL